MATPATVDTSSLLQLITDCCYLQARESYQQLLVENNLPDSWLPEDETEAASIKRALERAKECAEVLKDMTVESESGINSNWIHATTHFGITCHYQLGDDGIVMVRMEGNMTDLPLFEQAAVIHEVEFFKTWIPFCNDSHKVDKIGFADLVAYISLFIPPIGRDTIIYAWAADCLREASKIIISGKSVPSWPNGATKPTGWFQDTMDVKTFLAVIDVTNSTSARTTIVAKVDPRTILPHSLINFVVRNLAGFMLYFFQLKVKDVIKHPDCEHAKCIRENTHFYRDWLKPKLEGFCKLKGWDPPVIPYFDDKSSATTTDATDTKSSAVENKKQ